MSDIDKKKSNSSTDDKNLGRRKIVKSLVAGGGVIGASSTVDKWAKPVVDSLTLPAHAQTTMADPLGNFVVEDRAITMNSNEMFNEMLSDESLSEELLEFFLPSAQAGIGPCDAGNCSVDINATFSSTTANFCLNVMGSASGSDQGSTSINPDSNPPSCGSVDLGPVIINSGEFVNGEWVLDVLVFGMSSNVSTNIALTVGGLECDPSAM